MFIPRLNKPLSTNKFYIKIPKGTNPCILGNQQYRDKDLNVLPNCVGYVCGRFNEILGDQRYNLNMDAKNIFTNAKSLGLRTGLVPQVGAVIVWSNQQSGHCAIVEQVISPTEIIVSQSGWSSKTPFWTATHKKGNGNWLEGGDYKWMKDRYTFAGFVYNPAIKQDEKVMESKELKVQYKGKTITIKDNYLADGKNYPAIRELLESMGYKVGWNSSTKAVTINE